MPGLQTAFAQGLLASRPAASTANSGYYFLATDVNGGTLYQSTGSAWVQLAAGVSSAASTPTVSWVTKTAAYTLLATDSGVLADATSAAFTLTLPTAVGATALYLLKKKDSSSHAVTVATTSSQTIDGTTTKTLTQQYDSVTLASDGSNWSVCAAALGSAVQLDYAAATDILNATTLVTNTWIDALSNQTFTVDDAGSVVEIAVSGNIVCGGGTGNQEIGSRLVLDSAGTPINKMVGGSARAASGFCNALAGANVVAVTGLAAGSHTIKVQLQSNAPSNGDVAYCRAATVPNLESLQIRIVERKRW